MTFRFVSQLAGSCSHNATRGMAAGLFAIEAFFGLSAGDYTAAGLRSRLGRRFAAEPGPGFCQLLMAWGPFLHGVGRGGEAVALFRWVFRLTGRGLTDGRVLAARVRARLAGVPPELTLSLLGGIPLVMHPVLSAAVTLQFSEAWLGIRARDYRDPAVMLRRLGWDREKDEDVPEWTLAVAIGLLQTLAAAPSRGGLLRSFGA